MLSNIISCTCISLYTYSVPGGMEAHVHVRMCIYYVRTCMYVCMYVHIYVCKRTIILYLYMYLSGGLGVLVEHEVKAFWFLEEVRLLQLCLQGGGREGDGEEMRDSSVFQRVLNVLDLVQDGGLLCLPVGVGGEKGRRRERSISL